MFEFGAVVFPTYAEATAGVRSLTDWYVQWTPARRERALVLLGIRG